MNIHGSSVITIVALAVATKTYLTFAVNTWRSKYFLLMQLYIHTYHSRFIPEGEAEASQIYQNYLALPTNSHWARVVGYGPFFLCIIHKEGLCHSCGDTNGLMMMMI
jgi:hypothetical protein